MYLPLLNTLLKGPSKSLALIVADRDPGNCPGPEFPGTGSRERVQQGMWNKPRQALAHVESRGVEASLPPPRALIPPPARQQIQSSNSGRGMDLDGAHPGSSQAAQSVIRSYRIVYVYIVIYFLSSNTVS
jgi:hypothetical protein